MKNFQVSIVGGGICGLTTAIGLHNAGVPIKVFESASRLAEIGAGISIGPNCQNALKGLGLYDDFHKLADFPPRRLFFRWRRGDTENQEVLAETVCKQYGAASIHRAELLNSLVKHLPQEHVSFGKRLSKIVQPTEDDVKVTLHFADGSTQQTNVVIGCDGIHSSVRGALDPSPERSGPSAVAGSDALRWSGTWAYRGLIPRARFEEAVGGDLAKHYAEEPQMFLGKDRHVLIFPIEGGNVVNLVAFRTDRSQWPERPNMKPGEPWVQETSKEAMLADFEGWDENILRMLECIDKPKKWALHQLIPPLESYVSGRVVVVGDAAHGGTPHQGAMAGQAVEDALFLSRLFGHPNVNAANVKTALGAIDEIRVPRANEVLEKSLEVGDVYEFAGPLKDDIKRLGTDLVNRFDYLWDYDLDNEHRLLKQWLARHGI